MGDVYRVLHEPLDPDAVARAVRTDACGAVASFVGTVRSPNRGHVVQRLEYEGYEAMILAEMERIAGELREGFDIVSVGLVHRLGTLAVGDASIVVTVAAEHRGPALKACERGIDLCKQRLPIWKREVTDSGTAWVEGAEPVRPVL